jgi:ELWxxDGT repeat protein
MFRRNSVMSLGTFAHACSLRIEPLENRLLLALTPELVADIAVGASAPDKLTGMNGTLYFSAFNDSTGRELWKSDGTAGGTQLVRDLAPGSHEIYVCDEPVYCNNGHYETVPIDSSPGFLTNINGTLYFEAYDAVNGRELQKSDGTEAGTVTVKDIRAGSGSSQPYYLTNVNETLFFTANFDGNGFELWKSDGTEIGTVRMKNISRYSGSLTSVNGTLFFAAGSGDELWKSDGTATGTLQIKEHLWLLSNLTNVDGALFFTAVDGANGNELWKSDGTVAGTGAVQDIHAGTNWGAIRNLTNVNGTLYFSADDGVRGEELWMSDGTSEGTQLVRDLAPGAQEEYVCEFYDPDEEICERGQYEILPDSSLPHNLTPFGAQFYFATNDGIHGDELWVSDGMEVGTHLVADIFDGPAASAPANLTVVGNLLFFTASDGVHGEELWVSDGTEPGTYLVADIANGLQSSAPAKLTAVGNTLFFSADDGIHGRELWKVVVEDEASPGDTNGDGAVNIQDLNNVRNHFGATGDGVLGDTAPFDDKVDIQDLNAVRNNFGTGGGVAPRDDAAGRIAAPVGSAIGRRDVGLADAATALQRKIENRAADALFSMLASGSPSELTQKLVSRRRIAQ